MWVTTRKQLGHGDSHGPWNPLGLRGTARVGKELEGQSWKLKLVLALVPQGPPGPLGPPWAPWGAPRGPLGPPRGPLGSPWVPWGPLGPWEKPLKAYRPRKFENLPEI